MAQRQTPKLGQRVCTSSRTLQTKPSTSFEIKSSLNLSLYLASEVQRFRGVGMVQASASYKMDPTLSADARRQAVGWPHWFHESKWDGYRVSAYVADGKATIRPRGDQREAAGLGIDSSCVLIRVDVLVSLRRSMAWRCLGPIGRAT